jgi:hypothetical protein
VGTVVDEDDGCWHPAAVRTNNPKNGEGRESQEPGTSLYVPGFTNQFCGMVLPPLRTDGQLYVIGALPMSFVSMFVDKVSTRLVEITAPVMLPPPAPCRFTSFCA